MDVITDDERLYRRIPVGPGYCTTDPATQRLNVSAQAFHPHRERDVDGLSLSRGRTESHPTFLSPEDLAKSGPSPEGYFLAELIYGELRKAGIRVIPDPQPHDPGHVLLPELNSSDRKSDRVKELEMQLATTLTHFVHGPFPGTPRT